MKKILPFIILFVAVVLLSYVSFLSSCTQSRAADNPGYPKALSNYSDFKTLVNDVEKHRESHLVSLNTFLKMQSESNTIVLDARSSDRFERKHLKGAVHLSFTDFTQANLNRIIPDPHTRILIYCNNNFEGDQINFATKAVIPHVGRDNILQNQKPLMLALNIPTYINLYGYGYTNVYELGELVKINDNRISFEGTDVNKTPL